MQIRHKSHITQNQPYTTEKILLLLVLVLLATTAISLGQPCITITTEPQGQTVCKGSVMTLSVVATGTEPLRYQWQHAFDLYNYVDRPNETNSTLVINNPQNADSGYYRVIITNAECSVTSALALVTVASAPTIPTAAQPTNFTASLGSSAANIIRVTGPQMTYQWRFNGTNIAGQTKPTINLTNLQTANAGNYDVVLSNMCGSITSRVAVLNVDPTFTKITQGKPATDSEGSASVTWIDYDQDGWLDLFVGNAYPGGSGLNSLYHNNRDGSFTKITTNLLGSVSGSAWGIAWGDYDNDGKVDLFLANTENKTPFLFHNEGGGAFTRVTTGAMVTAALDGITALWGDYDNDGFIDLFLSTGWSSGRQNDRLYHNEGSGVFRTATAAEVGSAVADNSTGQASGWIDYDNDGDLDLFVTYMANATTRSATNFMFRNSLNGPFEKVAMTVFDSASHPWGVAWGDYDNDGYVDVFFPSMDSTNGLFRNLQGQGFTNVASTAGLQFSMGSASAVWGDYDNDGWLDLFVGNYQGGATYSGSNALFRNNHDGTFTRITSGSPSNDGGRAVAAAWGDYDNDGFLDLYVACGDGTAQQNLFYRNNGNTNRWLKLQLDGRVSNRLGIGAKVRVLANIDGQTFWQMRTISGQHSWIGNDGLIAHFGLGDAPNITTLRIEWPSGIVQELQNVPANQFLTVVEHQDYAGAAPQIGGVTNSTGGLKLGFSEPEAGARYILEASTNLVTWTKLMARTSAGVTTNYTDTRATNYTRRFYRLQVPLGEK